jgi:hypothetical protein
VARVLNLTPSQPQLAPLKPSGPFILLSRHSPRQFDGHGLLRQAARRCAATSPSPIPSTLWASGFSFSWARPVLEACPYDPCLRHLFFGEELSMAAR